MNGKESAAKPGTFRRPEIAGRWVPVTCTEMTSVGAEGPNLSPLPTTQVHSASSVSLRGPGARAGTSGRWARVGSARRYSATSEGSRSRTAVVRRPERQGPPFKTDARWPANRSSAGGPPPSCAAERRRPHPNPMSKSEAVPLRAPCDHPYSGPRTVAVTPPRASAPSRSRLPTRTAHAESCA